MPDSWKWALIAALASAVGATSATLLWRIADRLNSSDDAVSVIERVQVGHGGRLRCLEYTNTMCREQRRGGE